MVWSVLAGTIAIPLAIAAASPLLAWRQPVYIAAGFAGIVGMALLLLQPLLAGGYLPGLGRRTGRRVHAWSGLLLLACIVLHVAGLWLTSPPDVIDALLFRSPSPFSAWGVIAMWALFAAAALVGLRQRFRVPPPYWRLGHTALVSVAVAGSVVHALLIEGTMGVVSKTALCALAIAATVKAVTDLRSYAVLTRRQP